ncbi:hypothetical protein BDM02DRAFT_3187703 [Thelephora ganbajun]|uniref:Uncharacterized protein n=1 Tax=Thelephora ganbajun TaxID=370292 RepID=A0ACB6ZEE3_THEGA|nr:hypothetical protein BDM02DRAFT_3187703 [Thelephora ganbajun]
MGVSPTNPQGLTTDPPIEASPNNRLHSASTFFEIPVDGPPYLVSQGNFSYGFTELLPATSLFEDGQRGVGTIREQKINVEVNTEYRDPSIFDWARVCIIGGENTEDGTQGAGVASPTTSGELTRDSVFSKVGVMVQIPVASVATPKGTNFI